MGYSGAEGKLIHEKKTWSRKSRGTVPLMPKIKLVFMETRMTKCDNAERVCYRLFLLVQFQCLQFMAQSASVING